MFEASPLWKGKDMDLQIASEMALTRVALRVALAGDGWVSWPEREGGAWSAMLPGGSILEVSDGGHAKLVIPGGRVLGRQRRIDEPGFFASLMHNCDVMIGRGYGPGAVEVVRLADALADYGWTELKKAVIAAAPGPHDEPASARRKLLEDEPLLAALANDSVPVLRTSYLAWKSFRENPELCAAWDDVASLVRWARWRPVRPAWFWDQRRAPTEPSPDANRPMP